MEVLVQQTAEEYIADQQRIAELEEILMQPQENPFNLTVGKEVVILRNSATEKQTAGRVGTVLEIREPNGLYYIDQWPVVVLIDDIHYLMALNEVAVIG